MKDRIGIYALWDLNWDGTTLAGLHCHIRYIRHFLNHVSKLKLFTSINGNRSDQDDCISHPNLEVIPVPWGSFTGAWTHLPKVFSVFSANLDNIDALYIRLFDPCAWMLGPLCNRRKIGTVFHIVGDPIAGIYERSDWSGPGKLFRRILFLPEELLTWNAVQSQVLLFSGSDLKQRYAVRGSHGEVIIDSVLEESDFSYPKGNSLHGCTTVLFVGFLRPPKRVEFLIEAVGMLISEDRNIKLRIVGSGEERYVTYLKSLVSERNLSKSVEFIGYLPMGDGLNKEYRTADIFAFPSATEGAARSLLEAAANSLPIITTNVGSARDLFIDGESALIVPPNDPVEIAIALRRFIEDPALRKKCMENARRSAGGRSVRTHVKVILEYLNRASEIARSNV
ncbi:glycosyltransferase [Desulfomonile tiedjei DSM 6799]|uniref:Glycosyltransferase n=1 Tax=Desulfomonile tiedjei (strain ATCC 49306 / DSM 6799 / DCB-1) TaxID=706587 RepID=I4CCA4_DESTA|nr:glycosyltransferase [Desulfomonile tiedjei DSM 6799]